MVEQGPVDGQLVQIGWRYTNDAPEAQIAAGVHFHKDGHLEWCEMCSKELHSACEPVYVLRVGEVSDDAE